jgi:hypothetical protein
MKQSEMLLSVLVVSFNTRDVTRECLKRVYEYGAGLAMEVGSATKIYLIRSDLPLMVRQAHHERKINEL